MKIMPPLIGLSLFLVSCERQERAMREEPETLVREFEEGAMDAAITTARGKIDEFLSVLETQSADFYSVKAPITDENGTEHFWLTEVTYADGVFSGVIGNEPGIVGNVNFGQLWSVQRDEISDWMYTRDEKIHGGFTIDPLLSSYPKAEADALRDKLVR